MGQVSQLNWKYCIVKLHYEPFPTVKLLLETLMLHVGVSKRIQGDESAAVQGNDLLHYYC